MGYEKYAKTQSFIMLKYLNRDRKIKKIDIERLGSLVINLAKYLKKDF